jgi:hypothetical protein
MTVRAQVNQDFADMVACLADQGVDFLVVGAYALAAHGFPRATCWSDPVGTTPSASFARSPRLELPWRRTV